MGVYDEALDYFGQNQGISAITGKPMLTPEQKFEHLPTREQVTDFYSDAVDYFKGNIFGREPEGKWFDADRVSGKERPALYAEPEYNWEMGEVDAFHGGGVFKKFTNDFMKTGTGGHVFGWGHYVSEEKGVGKYYADLYAKEHGGSVIPEKLLINGREYTGGNDITRNILKQEGDFDSAIKVASEEIDRISKRTGTVQENPGLIKQYEMAREKIQQLKNSRSSIKVIPKEVIEGESGHYKVKLFKGQDPSEYSFLDWDKPVGEDVARKIAEQWKKEQKWDAQNIQNVYSDIGMRGGETKGEIVYKHLSQHFGGADYTKTGSKEAASKFLNRAGIDGIRFPVGTLSGIKDAGKKNYVIFDPKNIQIEEGPGFRRVMEGGKPVRARKAE